MARRPSIPLMTQAAIVDVDDDARSMTALVVEANRDINTRSRGGCPVDRSGDRRSASSTPGRLASGTWWSQSRLVWTHCWRGPVDVEEFDFVAGNVVDPGRRC